MILSDMLRSEQEKKIIFIMMFVGLFLISGTRFELGGNDYYIYRRGYEAVPKLWDLKHIDSAIHGIRLVNNFEIGYLLFNSAIKTLGFNFYGFTLIEAGIWYFCMYHGLKRYVKDWAIIFPVFLYKLFFYNTFISMRQSITIAIFFMAWQYIQDRKIIKYYLCCIFALLFHNGAIILFAIYPVLQLKLTKKRLLICNVLAWPFWIFDKLGFSIFKIIRYILNYVPYDNVLIMKAKQWLSMDYPLSVFHIFEYILLMLFVIIYYDKIVKDEEHEFIVKLFVLLLPIFGIFGGNVISTRFKDYFTITYGIILMYLSHIDAGKRKYIVQIGTTVVCAYGYFRYLNNFDAGGLLPYTSYISKGIGIFN